VYLVLLAYPPLSVFDGVILVLMKVGVAPEHCLVIEDAVAGVQAAHAGGMRRLAVTEDRDLEELRAAKLSVKDLTQVNLARIRELA
jgi:beta-phosphoglucomutase